MPKPEHKDDIVRVRHMLDYADKAILFTGGCKRSDLDNNEMLALAVIHLIEILGEASRSVSAELKVKMTTAAVKIVANTTKNFFIGALLGKIHGNESKT